MLRSKILRKFLLAIVVLVIGYTVTIFFVALPKIDSTINQLESQNAKEILDKIVLLTDHTGKNLADFEEEAMRRHKKELRDVVGMVYTMMQEAYEKSLEHPEEEVQLKAEVLSWIKKLRYSDNDYIFVLDYNATILSHPYMNEGKDMSRIHDINGKLIAPEIVRTAREHGEGYTRYWWTKTDVRGKAYEKLTFSKDFTPWQMVIGSGVYIDDIEKEVQRRKKELFQELRQIMLKTKIGKAGYIYIFDEEKMIIHPNSNINGKNFKKLPNPGKGTYIYDDLIKAANGSGVLRYKWDKPSDKGNYIYDKISWIRYVPSMNLYVVSSAYVNELQETSTKLHDEILYIGIFILLLSLVMSTIYLHRKLKPIQELAKMAERIGKGDYSIRAKVCTNDEIGLLARQFNLMVDKLQNQIQNLDKMVQEKTEALRELAITDALTKLYNRRYFNEVSIEMFRLGKRIDKPLSMMMIDIDRFKRVNDTYGHLVGDRVLSTISTLILKIKRESDIVCRYGGEEFVFLLPETDKEGAFELAERLRKTIEEYEIVLEEGERLHFTVSIGIAEADYSKDKGIEDVIRRADDAMYIAKRDGRNTIRTL